MQILDSLGVDVHLLIAQIINFMLVLFVLNKFLFRPIIKEIRKENMENKKIELEKEKLQKEIEEVENIKKNEIRNAKIKVKKILEEAEEIAFEIKERAQNEIDREKKAVIAQIKSRLK